MNLLARIQLASELDLLVSELSAGTMSMLEKIKKAGRLDEVVTLLSGEAGQVPAATADATQDTLEQLLKKNQTLKVRLKKDRRFTILFKRYHTWINTQDRTAGQAFEKEMSIDVAEDVSGIEVGNIRLYKQLESDLTEGTKLIRQGKYIAIEPYISPKIRKTPQVHSFLNWLYQDGYLLTGDLAKPDYNGKGEAIEDRNHFTVERMIDNKMQYVTFQRGEKIKMLWGGGNRYRIVTITGISHADKTFKFDNGSNGIEWGSAYKLTYDMFDSIRESLEKRVQAYENVNIIMDINYQPILKEFLQYQDNLSYELEDATERLKAAYVLRLEKQKQNQVDYDARQQKAADDAKTEQEKEKEKRDQLKAALPEFVEMTMEEWKRTSKDFKHIEAGQRYVLRFEAGLGTISRPVKIIKAVKPEDEPLKDAKTLEAEANAEFEAEAIEQGQAEDKPVDEAGVFYQSVIDGAEVDADTIQTAIDFARQDENHYLLPEAAETIKNAVLKQAEMII